MTESEPGEKAASTGPPRPRPIDGYALLADCHSAALVDRAGSVDWLCLPRFDAPSIFGRLLDDGAGHWVVRPVAPFSTERRYREGTLVLETTLRTDAGVVRLMDALAVGPNERGHDLGAAAPHALLRVVEGVEGHVEVECEYAPRPEYGLVRPLLEPVDGGVAGRGGASVLLLSSEVPLTAGDGVARGRFVLAAGERAAFALQHRSTSEAPPEHWTAAEIARRLDDTADAWASWSRLHQRYDGPWRELVHQSGRVLQALTYVRTGAMVAAPTTSLPETVGGPRNWDYRYCWIRDASLTLEALWVAACPDEAHRFFEFLAGTALAQVHAGGDLQIMFGVGGEHDLPERELPWLRGWRGSRPVRVGNGAWNQRQLDVYGELLGAAHRLADQLGELGAPTRRLLVAAADAAAARWRQTDHGIWEMRGEPRHFLHSKLMCWVALDRAIALAGALGAEHRVRAWSDERDAIRRAILERGWSDRAGAFTQSFGAEALDASGLLIPIVGFLPADDPRVRATVAAIADGLTDHRGLVFRYRAADGLEGGEGTFLLCTFWLAHARALAGELAEAEETFARAAAFANDLGLMAEEADPDTGELLGNFPQAFSHVGLVNAAWAIAEAARDRGRTSPS